MFQVETWVWILGRTGEYVKEGGWAEMGKCLSVFTLVAGYLAMGRRACVAAMEVDGVLRVVW